MLRDHIMPWVLGTTDLGDDVLEVGSGPGLTTDLLRARAAVLTAVEPEAGLVADLSSRLAGTNVEVVQAEAIDLPFADDRFSGAVSFSFLHHVPTLALQDQLFAGLARVLRAGGVLVAFDGVTTPGIAALHAGLPYNPIDPGTLESRLLAAGFVSVKVRTLDLGWTAKASIAT